MAHYNEQKTPSQRLYIIDESKLELGDILLTTTSHLVSRTIRLVTAGDFSHAMLYVGAGHYIDATAKGVQAWLLHRQLFTAPAFCKVLRTRTPLGSAFDIVEEYVRRHIAMEYTTSDAALAGVFQLTAARNRNRQFCSRLVAQAYEAAGRPLVNNAAYCTPENINRATSVLREVPNCLRIASSLDIAQAQKEGYDEIMARVQSQLFRDIKNVTWQDVQTPEQLTALAVNFPHYDIPIAKLLKSSGYLDLWQQEEKKNPWEYDRMLFAAAFPNPIERVVMAKQALEQEAVLRRYYIPTLQALQNVYQQRPGETLKLQIQMYQHLMNQMKRRTIVWKETLQGFFANP